MALVDDASLVVTPNGYKEGTLYSIKPTSGLGDMTVVRATTATRVNSAGLIESVANNVPRLDYTDSTCPSLLVEPQRTNLCLYSEQLDNAAWTQNTTSVTANATTSPDGTQNADTITSISALPSIASPIAVFTSTTNVSIFVKYVSQQWVTLMSGGAVNDYANFDIQNGVIGSVGSTSSNAQIQSFGNGWYRISVTFSGYAGNTNLYFGFIASGTSGWNTFDPNFNKSLYAWGCQIENSSYPTSYIPTTTASVTRNEDYLTRAGFGNSSISGTLFFDFYAKKIESSNGQYLLQLFEGSIITNATYSQTNGLSILANGNVIEIRNNGFTQTLQTITPTNNQRLKIAIRYNGTDISSAINGTLSNVLADSSVGVKNALRINNGESGTQAFNALVFFPSYLTNAELASLTT